MSTTSELEPYAGGQLEQYQARVVMTPEQAKALDEQVRLCTKAVLREGTDYGVIPGTGDRKVLLKPGAEKLLQFFGFGFTCDRQDIDRDDDGHKEGVTYRCTVTKLLGDGRIVPVTTCEGYAGYDEAKFYQSAEAAQFKAEANERKWAAKDRRVANPNKWLYITEYRAPWNTIIKMAQKRAIVGATIDATAAAGLFGQEEEEGTVADDGSTWFEQALEQAAAFTDPAEEGKLYVAAAHAARDGLCTPKQANHVQNRLRQRGNQLRAAAPVDVEDLGRQAAAATPPLPGEEVITAPVPGGTSAVAGEAAHAAAAGPGAAEGSPGDDRHRKLVGAVQGHFKRLGFGDEDKAERLWAAGKLAGVLNPESLNDLDPDELAAVADYLAKCRDRKTLEAVLATAGKTDDGA